MSNIGHAEEAYHRGIARFNEFLTAPSLITWSVAMNALDDAMACRELPRGQSAEAYYRAGLLWQFDSDCRSPGGREGKPCGGRDNPQRAALQGY